ncbi:AbrB/MazE/SpoVT family DNA-binding domain-containing protein [bacterium]|jgi:AbrB family looped-hinge helix DNA binding protein|nr:AbrB/MazE/SpoVT family DNA-binding domain-containing protein [bacterium]
MTITIDKAGRVVIPKSIRERLNLIPGSELEIDVKGNEINMAASSTETKLIEKKGVLVFDGRSDADIGIAEFIRRQRSQPAIADLR